MVISISRQLGSGGSYLGRRLARRLGLRYVDREILRQAASQLAEEEQILATREERVSGFWENFFRAMSVAVPEAGYVPPPVQILYDDDLFTVEAAIIRRVAAAGDAVIVGRGGFHILRGEKGMLHLFLHANREFRCGRVAVLYGKKRPEAAAMVDESDRQRRRFIEALAGRDWQDACNYHLALDTATAGFPAAEDAVARITAAIGTAEKGG